ncbi:hypothetical protein M2138_000356 [Dysgonomonadaceae bacterium PH5-43]|nr:hypothetical protein [Dysgonomonadaceae bacterium PH5-43]
MDIDLVYLWVNGDDPKWIKKRNKYINGKNEENSDTTGKGRYTNNDELKYSLRSIEKYAPWIRNIFIVTDDQIPEWLDTTNSKVKIIDHKDIMPTESLPCFNSSVIEYFIYRIPNLSEHFIYANDDMLLYSPMCQEDFFTKEGFPIVRLKRTPFIKLRYKFKRLLTGGLRYYKSLIVNSVSLVEKRYGKVFSGIPHHGIDSFVKSDYKEAIENIFKTEVEKSYQNKVRTIGDFHRSAISYYVLAIQHGELKYVGRNESMRISLHRHKAIIPRLRRYKPKFICVNDSQRVKDSDREQIRPILEYIYPEKIKFEK